MPPTLDEVLADDWFGDVSLLTSADLRAKRDICRRLEAAVSYERRVIQGQLDIVRAEADRRSQQGKDVSGILEALPSVLGSGARPRTARGDLRASPVVAPDSEVTGEYIGDLEGLDVDELEALASRLTAREQTLSAQRRALFGLIDTAQDEIARRYKSGAALVSDVIDERL